MMLPKANSDYKYCYKGEAWGMKFVALGCRDVKLQNFSYCIICFDAALSAVRDAGSTALYEYICL